MLHTGDVDDSKFHRAILPHDLPLTVKCSHGQQSQVFQESARTVDVLQVAMIWFGVVRMTRPPKVDFLPASITLNESRYQCSHGHYGKKFRVVHF